MRNIKFTTLTLSISVIMVTACYADTTPETIAPEQAVNIHTVAPIDNTVKPRVNISTGDEVNPTPPAVNINTGNQADINSFPKTISSTTQSAIIQSKSDTQADANYPKYGALLIAELNNIQDDKQALSVIVKTADNLSKQQLKYLEEQLHNTVSKNSKNIVILDGDWYTQSNVKNLKKLAKSDLITTISLQPVSSIPTPVNPDMQPTDVVDANNTQTKQKQQVASQVSSIAQNILLLNQLEVVKPNQTRAISTFGIDQVAKSALLATQNPTSQPRPSWLLPNISTLNQPNAQLPSTYQNHNQILYRQEMQVNPSYLQTYQTNLMGQAIVLDFNKSALATKTANTQLDKLSHGLIKDFYTEDNFSKNDAIISNLLHFKANWQDKFDKSKTQDLDFISVKGKKTKVATMSQEMEAYVATLDGWQYVGVPFSDGSMLQIFVTPDKQLTAIPTETMVNQLLKSSQKQKINLQLPKLELKSDKVNLTELAPELQQWQFTKLLDKQVLKNPLLQQQVVVTWDEEGAEAAAATSMFLSKGMSVTPTVSINQPFAFFIRYEDEVPFSGVVREIK